MIPLTVRSASASEHQFCAFGCGVARRQIVEVEQRRYLVHVMKGQPNFSGIGIASDRFPLTVTQGSCGMTHGHYSARPRMSAHLKFEKVDSNQPTLGRDPDAVA